MTNDEARMTNDEWPLTLQPEMEAATQHVGEVFFDVMKDLLVVVAGAEVGGDDEFVLEAIASLDKIVEVHVAMLVNFVLAVVGGDEGHFGDQDFGFVEVGIGI